MYGVTDEFLRLARSSRQIVTTVEVLESGSVSAELDVTIGGDVLIDRTSPIRRTCTATFIDNTGLLTPADASDLLAPYGNELRIAQGFMVNGAPETPTLGTFRVSAPEVREVDGKVEVTVQGFDRGRAVQRNGWTAPYVIAAGTNLAVAIEAGIVNRYPGAVCEMHPSDATLPRITLGMSGLGDPWEDFRRLARSDGMDLYVNRHGHFVMRPEPDPAVDPIVATYGESDTLRAITSLGRRWDDEQSYNGVVAVAEGSQLAVPLRTVLWDDDPTSPTYYLGKFGRHPKPYRTTLVTTQKQLDRAAAAELRRYLGVLEAVTFGFVTNPAHDEGDVIEIERTRLKIDAPYVIETLRVPLSPDDPNMTGTTRSRRVLS